MKVSGPSPLRAGRGVIASGLAWMAMQAAMGFAYKVGN
jgi:hypothetical protein